MKTDKLRDVAFVILAVAVLANTALNYYGTAKRAESCVCTASRQHGKLCGLAPETPFRIFRYGPSHVTVDVTLTREEFDRRFVGPDKGQIVGAEKP
jgi:hypothetical protein